MKPKGTILLMISRAGMELSWLYGWAAFVTAATLKRSFPLPEAVCVFILAAMSIRTRWVGFRKWRIIIIPIFHIICFSLAAAIIVYAFTDGLHPFLGTRWLTVFIHHPRSFMEWLKLGLTAGFILAFWVSGLTFVRRPATVISVGHRFDVGITAFLTLFILNLLLVYQGNIHVGDPYSEMLIIPFFIFSLFALGTISQRSHTPKVYLSGFHWIGVITSFSLVVVGLGTACFFFFLPYFTMAADVGYLALKTAAGPLGPVIVSILRFIFSPRRMRVDPPTPSSQPDNGPLSGIVETDASDTFIHNLIVWGLAIVGGLLLLVLTCAGIWYLARWLWHKFSHVPEYESGPDSLIKALLQLWLRLGVLSQHLLSWLNGYSTGVQLFGAIARWGRRSGIPRLTAETPLEYSRRLTHVFPFLRKEFNIILEAYHREVYAESRLDTGHLRSAQSAWQDLRSPRHWPRRIKAGFFGGSFPRSRKDGRNSDTP